MSDVGAPRTSEPRRWTIYVCPECGRHFHDDLACAGSNEESVEGWHDETAVVPVEVVERSALDRELRALRGTLTTETGLFGRDDGARAAEYADRCENAVETIDRILTDTDDEGGQHG